MPDVHFGRIDKWNEVPSCRGIVHGSENEPTTATCHKRMDYAKIMAKQKKARCKRAYAI